MTCARYYVGVFCTIVIYGYFYVSKNFHKVFGFEKDTIFLGKQEDIRERFHPEDFMINVANIKARNYIYEQPVERRKDYKFTHELRILNEKNKWVRCIIQSSNIELDAKGHFWLNMCLCDLSPIQDLDYPGRAVLWDTLTGDVIFSIEGKKQSNINVTEREKEVLSLISEGKISKEIADKLFISINTVNNHRKNIIEKLNVSNSSEAVKCAMKLGII